MTLSATNLKFFPRAVPVATKSLKMLTALKNKTDYIVFRKSLKITVEVGLEAAR